MKLSIKIIVVLIMTSALLLCLYTLDTMYYFGKNYTRPLEFLDNVIEIYTVVFSILVIFLTVVILISPQNIIKSSPELWDLLEKDKILQTKLTILKNEKELFEIQKDIDNLKSSKGKDNM